MPERLPHGDAAPKRGKPGPLLGHFHQPWSPSRLRLLWWRLFRPAKYRAWTCPIVFGGLVQAMPYSTPVDWDYPTPIKAPESQDPARCEKSPGNR